jgi:hypothetical protein
LGAQLCLRLSLRTSILKKLHLGPQNGPGSENLLKIVNCQNGQKIVLSHLENVGGPRYPPGSIIYYSLDQSPLQIDHVSYYKGPNPLLQIGQKIIIIGRIRSRSHNILKMPRNIIKVVITTQLEKSDLPVKRHFTHASLV